MSITVMKQALEALDAGPNAYLLMNTGGIANKLRQAIAVYQSAPPECQTEAEKAAYARGWWKAMETKRVPVTMAHRQTVWSKIDEKDKVSSYGLQLEAAHGFTGDMPDETGEQHEWAERVGLSGGKRGWVGLTDEEIDATLIDLMRQNKSGAVTISRAIEAKLKEKNT